MTGSTIRLTMAQALARWLTQQFTEIDGVRVPLFAGVFAIFGHGNVTCFSEALEGESRTVCRPGAGRTSSPWRSPRSPSPKPSAAGKS